MQMPPLPLPLPRRLHCARAAMVLADVLLGVKPADQLLETLYRNHREMGKRDRASVSGLVYGVLRDVLRLRALAGDAPEAWLARYLADLGHTPEAIIGINLPEPVPNTPISAAAQNNLPEDWYQRLVAQIGLEATQQLANALNSEAPIDLRINSLKSSRAQAQAQLALENIAAHATPHSPWGLRLEKRLSHTASIFADGIAEPQDEGSQLLALLVGATAGECVVDYCAGVGGKSLALAAMMQNSGQLIAGDVSASRLAKGQARAQRAGATIIERRTIVATGFDDLLNRADAVLVDAPCSGTGTLRRAPDWRLKILDIPAFAQLQLQILTDAALLVRPEGRLIYATCSLFAEEGEQVVDAFLTAHPHFVRDQSAPMRTALAAADGSLRLWPHVHKTDGFYACALRKKQA